MRDQNEIRYDYATYRTRERAEEALEDMFAFDEVSEGEFPKIEKRSGRVASWAPLRTRYVITLRAD